MTIDKSIIAQVAFEIPIDEMALEVDGQETGLFFGKAFFDKHGGCLWIDIEATDGSIITLTLRNTTFDKSCLYRMLHAVILRRCAVRILDAMHDYHHSQREQNIVDMATFRRSA